MLLLLWITAVLSGVEVCIGMYTVYLNLGIITKICSVGRGDSSHFPHIYNSTKTGRAGIVCSSVMVVPHMTFMHSDP